MSHFNFTILEGTVVSDIGILSNNAVKFRINSTFTYKNKSGISVIKEVEKDIVAYGHLADNIRKYLKTGSRVLVSGTLLNAVIEAKEINFMGAKNE